MISHYMPMILTFDTRFVFLVSALGNPNQKLYILLLACFLTIAYSMLSILIISKYEKHIKLKNNNLKILVHKFFIYLNSILLMFIIMSYNFWIILSMLIGQMLGYYFFKFKNVLKTKFDNNEELCC